jgi:hypothetical protein
VAKISKNTAEPYHIAPNTDTSKYRARRPETMQEDTDPVQHTDGMSRLTSPMQEFTMGQVTTGFVVLVIGLAVVVGVPLLL